MIHSQIRREVEAIVGSITSVARIGGGCISNASRIEAAGQPYFLKWSDGEAAATFEAEAEGLRTLRDCQSGIVIPEVFSAGPEYILLEWISEGRKDRHFWPRLGSGLAVLHRNCGPSFGFGTDNYIGRIEQVNGWVDNWCTFFLENRLEVQRRLARPAGRWRRGSGRPAAGLSVRAEAWAAWPSARWLCSHLRR